MKNLVYFLVPIILTWILLGNSGGAGSIQNVDRTGSPLGVGSCGSCHSGGNYSPMMTLELLDNNTSVTKYTAGKQYDVRVTIAAGNSPKGYGYQLVSLIGNANLQGGTFGTAPSGFKKTTLDGRVYVEQSSVRTSNTYTIPWTAPPVGSGNVRFFSAGVAVNGSGGTGGDSHVQMALPVTISEDLATLSLSTSSFSFPSLGSTESVNITSNTSWSITKSASYITVTPNSGTNNGSFTVKCDPNTSTSARTGTITVSGLGATTRTISFTQAGLTPILNVSPASLSFSDTGGTQSIAIESNMNWSLSETLTYVSLSASSGSNNNTIQVICSPNTSAAKRSGTITLSGTGVSSKVITINQNAALPFLAISPKILNFSQSGGTQTFAVNSNSSWNVIENLSYLSVNPTTGSNNATISVTIQPNTLPTSREGEIKIAALGVDTQIIKISQIGSTTNLTVAPTMMSFSEFGGLQKAAITSNTEWGVEENLSFIRVDSLKGLNNGGINVVCDSNFSAVTRTGVIMITGKGAVSKTINITQKGVLGVMTILPQLLDFTASGGKLSFIINSNTNWTISESLAHITVDKLTGSNVDTVVVTCTANTTIFPRSGIITISGIGVSNKIITTNQLGEVPRLTATPITPITFPATGGTKIIAISSNTNWTVSDSVTYISQNPSSGSNNSNVTISCSTNPSAFNRSTTLFISSPGLPVISIPITQSGAAASLTLSATSLIFPSIGGENFFNIVSNTSWNIVDTFPHLRFSPQSGTTNATVKVFCDTNFITSLKYSEVSVTAMGTTTKTINISQSGAEEKFLASTNQLNFNSSGGRKSFQISSNTSWQLSESASFISVDPPFGNYNDTINIVCDTNFSANTRKGKITFTGNGDAAISVEITQSGAFSVFSVLQDSIIFDSLSSSSSLKINGNTSWSLTKDVDWLNVNSISGSGNYTVNIAANENTIMQERIGKIFIKNLLVDTIKTVLVKQKGKKLQLPSSWQVKNSNFSHTIILPANLTSNIDGQPIKSGDFIGIFFANQSNEICAGFGAWTGTSSAFKVFGDDPSTANVKEGLKQGEVFILKIYRVSSKSIISAKAEFAEIGTQGLVISTDKYSNSGISMISKITGTSTPTFELLPKNAFNIFPNPSTQFVNIQIDMNLNGKSVLDIFNENGQQIQKHNFENWPAGKILSLDFSKLNAGPYFLKWSNNGLHWLGTVTILNK